MGESQFGARSTSDDIVRGMELTGRHYFVTGANAGIGFDTARALAAAGAHVLVGCRTAEKARGAAAQISARHPSAHVTPVELELGSFESVRRCAAELPVESLDAVICNAGLFASKYVETDDGLESTVGVCHFGHFLLVHSVLARLQAGEGGRVVMVSSEGHRHPARLNFDSFPLPPSHYGALTAYGQAKLCNVLFAKELTRRYQASGVVANALHPGSLIGTSIARNSVSAKLLFALMRPFTKTVPQGAATSVYCAVAPELRGVGGRYFVDCREARATAEANSAEVAARLWELSCERLGLNVEAAAEE